MSTTTLSKTDLSKVKARLKKLPQVKTSDEVIIDKAVANALLSANTHNRNLQLKKVEKYADEMNRGRWTDIGDPIRVSRTGVLLDGQHTLSAIAMADVAHPYTIVWGLEDRAQKYMDTGSKRSLAHALSLDGEAHPTLLGGATRMAWQIESGGTPGRLITEPTYEEYGEWIDANPEIRDSVTLATKVTRNIKVPASPVAAAHFFCAQVDKDEADNFFTDLGDFSVAVADDSPVAALRKTTMAWLRRGSLSRMEQASLYDVFIRAFDAHRDGIAMTGSFRLTRRPRTFRQPQP